KISASVLSPYFTSYNLEFGVGFNPDEWIVLIQNGLNQFAKQEIFKLNIQNFEDTVYTLRLFITQNNGHTSEERVNFHIDRTPPVAELVTLLPAWYGNISVPLASIYTDDPSIVRMFYRKIGENEFNFVTLDGFSTNNQFVKQLHYGFIPKDLAIQNTAYEIYFEAENLVGLKTEIKNEGNYYLVSTQVQAEFSTELIQPFSLPSGDIYENPMNITSTQNTNISLRNGENSDIYSFENNSFVLVDTLNLKYVRDFGDFNSNGLNDLLTYFTYDGFIEEQTSNLSASFSTKESIVSNNGEVRCWPILADDVDLDGVVEVFSLRDLNRVEVWDVQSNLKLKIVDTLLNFTPNGFGGNIINSPGATLSDIDDDGTKEIWMVDQDGDLFSYEIDINEFKKQFVIRTGFLGDASYLTSGDYNGDGKAELAVLLHSVSELDISPFHRLVVFNMIDSTVNILFDKAFVDASTEFNGAFRKTDNSIRFADINNDNKDELILFEFPYAYIFRLDGTNNTLISYKENINSNAVFIGDLNQNGVLEVAFPYSNKIEFLEFATSVYTSVPNNLTGYSLNPSSVKLEWNSSASKYYVYKGSTLNNIDLIDSTNIPSYFDSNIILDSTYYYGVKAYDPSKPKPFSGMSSIVEVYAHTPGKPDSAYSNSNRSVIVRFSEKMK
ncbi:MAG: VCBS repeat-containing protein, partial [Ignavibacteriaceae bacterium]